MFNKYFTSVFVIHLLFSDFKNKFRITDLLALPQNLTYAPVFMKSLGQQLICSSFFFFFSFYSSILKCGMKYSNQTWCVHLLFLCLSPLSKAYFLLPGKYRNILLYIWRHSWGNNGIILLADVEWANILLVPQTLWKYFCPSSYPLSPLYYLLLYHILWNFAFSRDRR